MPLKNKQQQEFIFMITSCRLAEFASYRLASTPDCRVSSGLLFLGLMIKGKNLLGMSDSHNGLLDHTEC